MKKFYLMAGLWAALFSAKAQYVASFDDVELQPGSFYNGSDGAGGFSSGGFWFPNNYNSEWGSWSGFALSNMKDTVTAGYENQYSAITGGGSALSENYALVYWPGALKMEFDTAVDITGFEVTNSTYAYLTMRDGDSNGFSKKFGGVDGTDPDFLKLLVWGTDTLGNLTDTVAFFLADYRFENPENDYLVKTWEWLNLTSLGAVKELHFGMESSDVGDWGINTPTYLCMDNFTAAKLTSAVNVNEITQELNVFPNPVNDVFYVEVPVGARALILTDNRGRMVFSQQVDGGTRLQVDALRNLPSGLYFLKVTTREGWLGRKILKR
jgi:hypothetical protein